MSEVLSDGLSMSRTHYDMMLADVRRCAPEEACGLVAGKLGQVTHIYTIDNALHSLTAYRMDAMEQIDAFLEIDKLNQVLLAIYHSHPVGPEMPSETDIAEFAYPGVITLIWFPKEDSWSCKAYWINDRQVVETTLHLDEDE